MNNIFNKFLEKINLIFADNKEENKKNNKKNKIKKKNNKPKKDITEKKKKDKKNLIGGNNEFITLPLNSSGQPEREFRQGDGSICKLYGPFTENNKTFYEIQKGYMKRTVSSRREYNGTPIWAPKEDKPVQRLYQHRDGGDRFYFKYINSRNGDINANNNVVNNTRRNINITIPLDDNRKPLREYTENDIVYHILGPFADIEDNNRIFYQRHAGQYGAVFRGLGSPIVWRNSLIPIQTIYQNTNGTFSLNNVDVLLTTINLRNNNRINNRNNNRINNRNNNRINNRINNRNTNRINNRNANSPQDYRPPPN